jgi:hypothetical protein
MLLELDLEYQKFEGDDAERGRRGDTGRIGKVREWGSEMVGSPLVPMLCMGMPAGGSASLFLETPVCYLTRFLTVALNP